MSLTVQEESTVLALDQQNQSLEVRASDPASVLEINQTVFALGICDASQPAVLNIEAQAYFLTVEAQDEPSVLEVPQHSVLVVTGPAAQGPVGPQGEVGPAGSTTLTLTAGEALNGHKAVVADNYFAYHADNQTAAHAGKVVGITTGASLSGATANIQAGGELTEPSWAWNPGPIYVGANGALTQTRPATGWIKVIAVAMTATKIAIQPRLTILRA